MSIFEHFLDHIKSNVTPNMFYSYKSFIKKFLLFQFKTTDVSINDIKRIIPNDMQNYFNKINSEGYSKSTLRQFKYSLIKFSNFLNEEYSYQLPKIDVRYEVEPKEIIADYLLTDIQVKEIANYANTTRDKAIILFLFETGMKVNELINVKTVDVDFEKLMVKIKNQEGDIDRIGYFSESTKIILQQYLDEYKGKYMSEHLFQTLRSSQISYSTIFKMFKDTVYKYFLKEGKKDGLDNPSEYAMKKSKNINIETLRESKRVLLFSEGKSVEHVQVIMGDKNKWRSKRYLKIAQMLYPDRF